MQDAVRQVVREALLLTAGKALDHDNDTNPVGDQSLERLAAGHGVDQRDMTREERDEKARQRRNRNERRLYRRKQQAQAITDSLNEATQDDDDRQANCWYAAGWLLDTSRTVLDVKARRFARYLGDTGIEDAELLVEQRLHTRLAQSKWDIVTLVCAARGLHDTPSGMPDVTGIDLGDEWVDKCARWMMKTINTIAAYALKDVYAERPTYEQLVVLDTIAESSRGVDEFIANAHANRQPVLVGARFQQPGKPNRARILQVLDDHIVARNLDVLVEVLIDWRHVDAIGQFRWDEHGHRAWLACTYGMTPEQVGRWTALWDKMSPDARREAVRTTIQNRFGWLPRTLMRAIDDELNLVTPSPAPDPSIVQAFIPADGPAKVVARRLLTELAAI